MTCNGHNARKRNIFTAEELIMKKAKIWRLLGGIGLVLLFSARVYTSYLEREERASQEQMMQDLSRMQYEQNESLREQMQEDLHQDMMNDLEESRARLDSIGKSLERSRLRFDSSLLED